MINPVLRTLFRYCVISALLLYLVLILGCSNSSSGGSSGNTADPAGAITQSSIPKAESYEVEAAAESVNTLAFDIYNHYTDGTDNIIFSPYTLLRSMSACIAGSTGDKKAQLMEYYHMNLYENRLQAAFHDLSNSLITSAGMNGQNHLLKLSPALWLQTSYAVESTFIDTLSEYYSFDFFTADFIDDPEAAGEAIDDILSNYSDGKLAKPTDPFTTFNRLVIADVIMLNGNWVQSFDPLNTTSGLFEIANCPAFLTEDQTPPKVPASLMTGTAVWPYMRGTDFSALEMSIDGGTIAVLFIIPDSGIFCEFQETMNHELISQIISALQPKEVALTLPLFNISKKIQMSEVFENTDVLTDAVPDFRGIHTDSNLFIKSHYQFSGLTVSEAGLISAASTILALNEVNSDDDSTSEITRIKIILDQENTHTEVEATRPFIYIIRDTASGTILFMGRVMDPQI